MGYGVPLAGGTLGKSKPDGYVNVRLLGFPVDLERFVPPPPHGFHLDVAESMIPLQLSHSGNRAVLGDLCLEHNFSFRALA